MDDKQRNEILAKGWDAVNELFCSFGYDRYNRQFDLFTKDNGYRYSFEPESDEVCEAFECASNDAFRSSDEGKKAKAFECFTNLFFDVPAVYEEDEPWNHGPTKYLALELKSDYSEFEVRTPLNGDQRFRDDNKERALRDIDKAFWYLGTDDEEDK